MSMFWMKEGLQAFFKKTDVVMCFRKNLIPLVQLKIRKKKPRIFYLFFELLKFHWNRKFRMKHKEQNKHFNSNLQF